MNIFKQYKNSVDDNDNDDVDPEIKVEQNETGENVLLLI